MESNFVDFAWFPTAKRLSSKASSIVLSVFTDLSIPIPFACLNSAYSSNCVVFFEYKIPFIFLNREHQSLQVL